MYIKTPPYNYIVNLLLTLMIFNATLVAQTGIIKGRVFNQKNNEPIPFTNIAIQGTNIGTTSDLNGNFIFTGIRPGFIKLMASSVGFENMLTKEIMVTNAKTVFVDISMKETFIQLENVEIKAPAFTRDNESPVSLRSLGISEIEKSPGGNRDVSKVLQTLPGVSSTPAYRNDVIVRGGGSSENTFYLDGIEIPNINHFATQGSSGGPVGIINIDFIREMNFYSGAFPANRGNALSSIIEMNQIDGNKDRVITKAAFGASDLALSLNGPIGGKNSFLFSARRSYLQFLFSALNLPFLPTYNDFQFKYKIKLDAKHEISVIGLGAIDEFKLNNDLKKPDEEQKYILGYLPVNEQWNYTLGVVYRHFHKKGFDTWVLSRNMLHNTSYKYPGNNESLSKLSDYKSDESENKFRYEHNIFLEELTINSGVGFEYARYTNSTIRNILTGDSIQNIQYKSKLHLFSWNAFSQISKSYLGEKLTVSLGIRFDGNSFSKSMQNPLNQVSPRLSFSYKVNGNLFINANTGIYYQQPPFTTLGFRNKAGELINKINNLKYINSNHVIVGIEYNPNEQSKFTLEGFYKFYNHYPFSVNDSVSIASKGTNFGSFGDEEVTSESKGKAYGAELYYRNANLMGFNIILSYTFVRSLFTDKNNLYVSSAWDNVHLLNITLLKQLKHNWNIGLKWKFVGGAPYTPLDLNRSSVMSVWDSQGRGYLDYNKYNTLRLSSFHQLDIRIDKEYFFSKWSLNFYLDIQNIYNFSADQQPQYTNLNTDGTPNIDPNNSNRYILRKLNPSSGNILPTIGIIVEF